MRLVAATRDPERFGLTDLARYITFGASPRASIHLIEGARALAFLRGRDYVLPEDVTDLVPDVLRHRLVLSYEALADALTADELVLRVMQHVRRRRSRSRPMSKSPLADGRAMRTHVAAAPTPARRDRTILRGSSGR